MAPRPLTEGELFIAHIVFGDVRDASGRPINWSSILIYDHPKNDRQDPGTVTADPTGIYYTSRDVAVYSEDFGALVTSRDWTAAFVFVHELAHVIQYQELMDVNANIAEIGRNYNYDGIFSGVPFYALNPEAQAEMYGDYFLKKIGALLNVDTSSYIDLAKGDDGIDGSISVHTLQEYEALLPSHFLVVDEKLLPGDFTHQMKGLFSRTATDPIVLDLNHDGVKLVGINDSAAQFDLHNTGFAVQTGWIDPQDGFLVVDRNGNGRVDNITELFGNDAVDGFTALQAMDSNHDNRITSADAGFASLKIWRDANGDGVTDPGELGTLAQYGITEIDLNTTPVDVTVNGNIIGDVASFKYADGTTAQVAEAYFDNSRMDATFTGPYTLNPEVLLLPNTRGYGTVPDLYIAMSLDDGLLQMVKALAQTPLADAASFDDQVLAILYRWAGSEGTDPSSRGPFINAQHLAVLEKFMGQGFVSAWQGVSSSNPANSHQGTVLEGAWLTLLKAVETRLLVQGPLGALLPGIGYDYIHDSISGATDFSAAMTALGAATPADPQAAQDYWSALAPKLISLAESLGVARGDYEPALQNAFALAGLEGSAAAIAAGTVTILHDESVNVALTDNAPHYVISGSGDDQLKTGAGNDVLIGGAGNDTLDGGAGNNILIGGAGDDRIIASGINDQIRGGSGNDSISLIGGVTYNTVINGGEGIDTLHAGSNTSLGTSTITDVEVLSVDGGTSLPAIASLNAAQLAGFDSIVVNSPFGSGILNATVAGTYDFTGKSLTGSIDVNGTAGNDVILAKAGIVFVNGKDGNDNITAGDTATDIHGGSGANVLTGGAGNDRIFIEGVGDEVRAGSGDDAIFLTNNGVRAVVIDGGDGIDTLHAASNANLGTALISNAEILSIDAGSSQVAAVTASASQLAGFSTIIGNNPAHIGILFAAGGGTYDFVSKTMQGTFEFRGSIGNDVLSAGTGINDIRGDAGNDILDASMAVNAVTISGGTGANVMRGGSGNDTINIQGNGDQVYAGAGNDSISVNTVSNGALGAAVIDGGDGIDTLHAASNTNLGAALISNAEVLSIDAGSSQVAAVTASASQLAGFTTIVGNNPAHIGILFAAGGGTYDFASKAMQGTFEFRGSTGDDVLLAGTNVNDIRGDAGNDFLDASMATLAVRMQGGIGTNTLLTGAGNDTIFVQGTNDHVSADAGNDSIILDTGAFGNFGAAVIDGGSGNDTFTAKGNLSAMSFSGVETLSLTGDTSITAAQLAVFSAISGNVAISAATAGTYDFAKIPMQGSFSFVGSAGDDTVIAGAGITRINGGAGVDMVDYSDAFAPVRVNLGLIAGDLVAPEAAGLSAQTAEDGMGGLDVVSFVEGVIGSAFDDVLIGTDGANFLDGGAGVDLLIGGLGDDTYVVDDYGDVIRDAGGTDTLQAAISWVLADELEKLTLLGFDALDGYGNEGNNILTGNEGNNLLYGFGGDDVILGVYGTDVLDGGDGNDTLVAGLGGDTTLLGGIGDDNLTGGAGNDILDGGSGADVMAGGGGVDTYYVDDVGDVVSDTDGGNVFSSVSFAMDGMLYDLTLTGASDLSAIGNAQNNFLMGNAGANFLSGEAGNDQINGLGGDDILLGGAGNDFLMGATGNDMVSGEDGDDSLGGDDGNDQLFGGVGNDTLHGWIGNDLLDGGDGIDTADYWSEDAGILVNLDITQHRLNTLLLAAGTALDGSAGNDALVSIENVRGSAFADYIYGNSDANTLNGSAGNDTLYGAAGDDTLLGGAGDDTLLGQIGNDVLFGDDGNDLLDGGGGADQMEGSLGDDTYIVRSASDVILENEAEGTDTVQSSVSLTLGANLENLALTGATDLRGHGNELDNLLIGNDGQNFLYGLDGNDRLSGLNGDDNLFGGTGNDSLDGGAGDDSLYGQGDDDSLTGGDGNDLLDGGGGADMMVGGAGNDAYFVNSAGDQAVEDAASGLDEVFSSVSYILPDNIENLSLTDILDRNGSGNLLNNVLTGNDGANRLRGFAGDDALLGGAGNDQLIGDEGNDILDGGAGDDTLSGGIGDDLLIGGIGNNSYAGGAGFDTVSYGAAAGGIVVDLGLTTQQTVSADTFDTFTGSIEAVIGSAYADTITGSNAINTLDGGAGDDVITGLGAADRIIGGLGNDLLTGGTGADTFVYGRGDGQDTITDFRNSTDFVDLTGFGITFSALSITAISGGVHVSLQAGFGAAGDLDLSIIGLNLGRTDATDFIFA